MPDIFSLLRRWYKRILLTVLLASGVAAGLSYLIRDQYLSEATALPASIYASDKAAVFNRNIEALYTSLGSSDDLDRIVGTASLDTVYLAVTDRFNLVEHYRFTGIPERTRMKAARSLKKNSRIRKSGYGELKVTVWDTDPKLAPQLANALLEQLDRMHRDLQGEGNRNRLQALRQARTRDQDSLLSWRNRPVSMSTRPDSSLLRSLPAQIAEFDKLIAEYELLAENPPAVLVVAERARPAMSPDRPKRLRLIVVTAFLAFLFGLLVAVVGERKNILR